MANPEYYDGSLFKKEAKPRGRRRIKFTSQKQDERIDYFHGLKAERLYRMASRPRRPMSDASIYYCEGDCGKCFQQWEDAWGALTISHVVPRNDTSTRYERRLVPELRGDHPNNILLECLDCNLAREPQPEWGKP